MTSPDNAEGFAPHDFAAPLDVEQHIARIPVELRVRAFFAEYILSHARKLGVAVDKTFEVGKSGDISLRESERFLASAAAALEPDVPHREAIRRTALHLYPALLSSPVGRVVFGVAARAPAAMIRLAPAGFRMSGTRARARVVSLAKGHAVIAIENSYSFIESVVASLESGFHAGGHATDVLVRVNSAIAFDLDIRWRATTTKPT